MHSWRVLILPFLEQQALYDAYRFDEPWDGPNNRRFAEIALREFNCEADHEEASTMTSYLAVVGPGTAWPGSQPVRFRDMRDGTDKTILVVEVANSGIHWMEPRDLHVVQMTPRINAPAGQGIRSRHPGGGVNVLFADAHIQYLSQDVTEEDLRAMLTIAGGEKVDPSTVNDPPVQKGEAE
jgi:prepilin-type processing-associated H-X9-DG protein